MMHSFRTVLFLSSLALLVSPFQAHAASFETSGWIPYWRTATGTADVLPHLKQFTEVNPFGYTVKNDGSLNDIGQFSEEPWTSFIAAAHTANVRVIPTVMTSNTEALDALLRNPESRAYHIRNIVDMVNTMGFDGVDIDYEGKRAETRPYFSLFLKELYAAMGKKLVSCTIEARTPVDSRYLTKPPVDATNYANDFVAINKYCDRVKFMTYDQQNVDVKLAKASAKIIYAPIADPAWITKTIQLAKKDIKASKIVIGVATYGYINQVIPNGDGSGFTYDIIQSFNPKYGVQEAALYGITPKRNSAGEIGFSYVPTSTPSTLPSQAVLAALAPKGTASALLASEGAKVYLKNTGKQAVFQYLAWSDASAIASKVALAKKLGVRGVAVFKLDGGEDQGIWNALK